MSDVEIERVSRKWEIVLAFFLGGAVSSLAQDPSDTLFFFASQQGWLSSATNQTFFWYWVPFLLYIGLFLLGYLLARTGKVSPSFLLYFYAFLVVISAFSSFVLKQATDQFYVATVILGTIISLGIIYGLRRKVV